MNGEIRATCHYGCKPSSCRCPRGERVLSGEVPALALDQSTVEAAVRSMSESEPNMTGYRMDFMLSRKDGEEDYTTELCEVNDGYVAGRYEGLTPGDFVDMVLERFRTLLGTRAGP